MARPTPSSSSKRVLQKACHPAWRHGVGPDGGNRRHRRPRLSPGGESRPTCQPPPRRCRRPACERREPAGIGLTGPDPFATPSEGRGWASARAADARAPAVCPGPHTALSDLGALGVLASWREPERKAQRCRRGGRWGAAWGVVALRHHPRRRRRRHGGSAPPRRPRAGWYRSGARPPPPPGWGRAPATAPPGPDRA